MKYKFLKILFLAVLVLIMGAFFSNSHIANADYSCGGVTVPSNQSEFAGACDSGWCFNGTNCVLGEPLTRGGGGLTPTTTLNLSSTSVLVNQSVTATWSSTQDATGCTGIIDNSNGDGGTTNYSLSSSGSNGNLGWSTPGTFGLSMFCTNGNGDGATVRKTVTVTSTVPTVTTTDPIINIDQTTATGGGNTTSNGGATVTQAGLVWGTSDPETNSPLGITYNGWADPGAWTSNITGLTAGTTYHVRAYATNSKGTAYGADVSFTTAAPTCVINSFTADNPTPPALTSTTLNFSLSGSFPWAITNNHGNYPSPALGTGSGTSKTGNIIGTNIYTLTCGTATKQLTIVPTTNPGTLSFFGIDKDSLGRYIAKSDDKWTANVTGGFANMSGEDCKTTNGGPLTCSDTGWIVTDANGNATTVGKGGFGSTTPWVCDSVNEKTSLDKIIWSNGYIYETNETTFICDVTRPVVTVNPSSGPGTFYGTAADGYGTGFSTAWTSVLGKFKDKTTGQYWVGTGYNSSSDSSLTGTYSPSISNSVNWSFASNYIPPVSAHVCGHAYQWTISINDEVSLIGSQTFDFTPNNLGVNCTGGSMSGTLSAISCEIPDGKSTCSSTVSGTTASLPSGSTTAVTKDNPSANTPVDTITTTPFSVNNNINYGTNNFYLYNSSSTAYLATASAVASCASTSDYISGVCRARHTITATQASNCTITPSGTTSIVNGSDLSYTIAPDTGYGVASLIIDGATITGATSKLFSNVIANHTISATCAPSACTNGGINYPACTCQAGSILINETCTPVDVSVSATTPYDVAPGASVDFTYTPTTNSTAGTECLLTDVSQNPLTAYKTSSSTNNSITYSVPNDVPGPFAYYIQCRDKTTTTATNFSNQIIVNTACATGTTWDEATSTCKTSATYGTIRGRKVDSNDNPIDIAGTSVNVGTYTSSANPYYFNSSTSNTLPTGTYTVSATEVAGYTISYNYSKNVGTTWAYPTPTSTSATPGHSGSSFSYTLGADETLDVRFIYTVNTVPLPDLTAGAVTPTSALVNTSTTFSTTISNIGGASTGKSFSNFFQVTDSTHDKTNPIDLSATTMATLTATGGTHDSDTATKSHTFTSTGTYSMRACADLPPQPNGVIDEGTTGGEDNNCSAWTNVTVAGVINGACGLTPANPTHYNCSAGTLGATAEYPDTANPTFYAYQWWCNGSNGGTNILCTENKIPPSPPSGTISAKDCGIPVDGSTCDTLVTWNTDHLTDGATEVTRNNTDATHLKHVSFLTSDNNFRVNVPHGLTGETTFFLYHNNAGVSEPPLAQVNMNASCDSGGIWTKGQDGSSTCKSLGGLSGTLTPEKPSCDIGEGYSSCPINFTWNTIGAVEGGTISGVRSDVNNFGAPWSDFHVSDPDTNSGYKAFDVPYNSRTFYLYNANQYKQLADSTVTSKCSTSPINTTWDSIKNKCVKVIINTCQDGKAGNYMSPLPCTCSINYTGTYPNCTPPGGGGGGSPDGGGPGPDGVVDEGCGNPPICSVYTNGNCVNGADNPLACTTKRDGNGKEICVNGNTNPPSCIKPTFKEN